MEYIPVRDVPLHVPPRKRGPISGSTVERWSRYGVAGGIRLKTLFIGSQEVTTKEFLDQFIREVSEHKLRSRRPLENHADVQ